MAWINDLIKKGGYQKGGRHFKRWWIHFVPSIFSYETSIFTNLTITKIKTNYVKCLFSNILLLFNFNYSYRTDVFTHGFIQFYFCNINSILFFLYNNSI